MTDERPVGWQDWDPCEHPPGARACGWCLPDEGRTPSRLPFDGQAHCTCKAMPVGHRVNEACMRLLDAEEGRGTTLREQVARAIAEAADDGVFDRDEPDSTSDDEDRDYWLRLADAARAAHATADWREQITSREAIRSELIRQHLAGECVVSPPARTTS